MKQLIPLVAVIALACGCSSYGDYSVETCCGEEGIGTMATCTGATSCKACKNCKYCKHCSKNGGACGVCKM